MAAHDFEKIYSVKKNVESRLLAIPGVHGVGLGAKYIGGERTHEPAIMVFLENKKPAIAIPSHEMIPAQIDGVKTDVIESTPPRLMADDTKTYRPLVGGGQIEGGGSLTSGGTLGCIARINGPVPTIVGITNHHCVGVADVAKTLLSVDFDLASPDKVVVFNGSNIGRTLIVVDWTPRTGNVLGTRNWAFYSTTKDDTPETIAQRIAENVTSLGAGLSAAATARRVTFTATDGGNFDYNVRVFGPPGYHNPPELQASLKGNEITLIGKATKHCGIFTKWNVGGEVPTGSVYTPVRKGAQLAELATQVAAAINGRGLPGISASPNGSKVTIAGPQQIECVVSSDVRIGQATDRFCSACCACCDRFIGVVRDARIEIDVALIELAAGLQYRAEIEGIGIIKGTRSYVKTDLQELLELNPRVRKRGAKTGLTFGFIQAVDQVGEITGSLDGRGDFHRKYSNIITIMPDKKLNKEFSGRGDSGSAVVNEAGEIIGILFGSSDGAPAYVTPIAEIEKAFDLSVVMATAPGQVSTVPANQVHALSMVEREPLFVDALRDVERELTATPVGRELAEVGRRHAHEVVQLVNHNRRVGTVWRRNGGPEIVQTALTMAQTGEKDPPRQINGRPLAEFLLKMQAILERYGSAQLATDLRRYGPRIIELTKFDYPQLLVALKTAQ